MPRIALQSRRTRTSCSIIALATVMAVGATPAAAQSFNGSGSFAVNSGGSANISTGVNTTTITLNPGQSVIDWSPSTAGTGNIIFQPVGTTATFTSTADFAVLNNVNGPIGRAIEMNGTVNSRINSNQGGSVYFYAPGGFVFGGTSVFNVGNLVVSALPVQVTGSSFISGADRTVTFGQATDPNASIIMNGTINAFIPALGFGLTGPGYVGIIAPKVVQNTTSTINANGSTALVAAEAATLSFSPDGLFDIQVSVGSTSATGIEVYGNIGGETPTGSGDQQRVYLVGVAKNSAMTMLIGNGADLGFTLADSAVDDNGAIILSAGHNVSNGSIVTATSSGQGLAATSSINFNGGHATNNVIADATGTANFSSDALHLTTTFDNSLTAHANGNLSVGSSGVGTSLNIADNLTLSGDRVAGTGGSVTGGNISLTAQTSGAINVGGAISMSADATGGDASSGTAGAATGGTITITADNSTLNFGGLATSATGTGGNATGLGVTGGAGTGGTITISAVNGGIVNVSSPLTFDVQGYGGSGGGSGAGGAGTGGTSAIVVGTNGALTFGSDVLLDADGFGGDSGSGTGGKGTGGTAGISTNNSTTGGLVTLNGAAEFSADGNGGLSNDGTGGAGQGGGAYLSATADHVVLNAGGDFHAIGDGGGSGTGTGGAGTGGTASVASGLVSGVSGEVDITGTLYLDTTGWGGDGAVGGIGQGGNSFITSQNNVDLNDYAYLYANGNGGGSSTGLGANGTGGTISVIANGGILTTNYVYANASGSGGSTEANGTLSGAGQGGSIDIQALANGTLTLGYYVDAYADGYGGDVLGASTSGNGIGGTINFGASGTNASVQLAQSAYLQANGEAGGAGDCNDCGAGGNGQGGNIFASASGTGATLHVTGSITERANGYGGTPVDGGTGGNGTGGHAQLAAFDGGSVDVDSYVDIEADGYGGGGYDFDLTTGGDGFGGLAEIITYGTGSPSLNIDGSANLSANGYGGEFSSFFSGTNSGGDGTGGVALVSANGGSIHVVSYLDVNGEGYGGDGGGSVAAEGFGIGGDGFGKSAEIDALNGGTVTVDGYASVSASGYGGNGTSGGNGTGGGVYDPNTNTGVDGAHIYARNGTITLNGSASVYSDGYGGDAGYYYGGTGSGGSGGNGAGGWAAIHAANSNGGSSIIKIQGIDSYADVSADGYGGDGDIGMDGMGGLDGLPGTDGLTGGAGGDGEDGEDGGAGGAGGTGHGGFAAATAAAGNGSLTIDQLYITAVGDGGSGGRGGDGGYGGTGGAGGTGSTGIGGNGGNGGDGGLGGNGGLGGAGFGDSITFGTESGSGQASGSGSGVATLGNVSADATAYGGNGGDGGFGGSAGSGGPAGLGTPSGNDGTTGNSGNFGVGGNGADGGDAVGGAVTLLVRGSTVNINGEADMYSDAYGGDGGYGGDLGLDGNGGDAAVGGEGGIGVLVTPRYLIPAQHGTLNANIISGRSVAEGGLGAIDGVGTALGQNYVSFVNSTGNIGSLDFTIGADELDADVLQDRVTIVGSTVTADNFSFDTVGNLSLYVDGSAFNVGALNLAAGNFVYDGRTPAATGSIVGDDVTIGTGGDFVANANWDVTNTFFVDAPGLIELDTVHDDNGIDFSAGGSISILGGFSAGTYIDLFAGGDIDTGDISAGTFIVEHSTGGSIEVGNITAGSNVSLIADTSIHGEDIDSTFGSIFAQTNSGDISLENLTAPFGSITLWAGNDLFLIAGDDPVTDGDILADGDIILNAGGVIDINDATGGYFEAHAGSTFDSLNLTSDADIRIDAGDDVTMGHLVAGLPVSSSKAIRIISDGSISLIDINALGGIDITAAGNVTGGAVTTGDVLFTDAVGSITYGNISAGLVNPQPQTEPFSVGLVAGTSIVAGNVDTAYGAAFISNGTLTTGDVDGGSGDVLGLVHGNINMGDITTGNRIYLADYSMYSDIGGTIPTTDNIDGSAIESIFAATPTRTGGSITVGDINAGSFIAAAGVNLNVGTLNADSDLSLDAGAAISTGNLTVGNFVLANGGSITTGTIDADSVDMTSTAGNITTGDIDAFGSVALDAFGDILTGDITAGSIDLFAGDDITTGDLTTQALALFGDFQTLLFPGASISLESGGDIATGDISSIDGVYANAGATLTTGAIDAVDFVSLFAVGNISTGNITAGTFLEASSDAAMSFGAIDAGDYVDLDSIGSIAFTSAIAGTEFSFDTSGSVTGGNVTAVNHIDGEAGGSVSLGNLSVTGGLPVDEDFSVGIAANGNINVGNVNATNAVGFASHGNLTTGNISAGDGLMGLVGGNITTGSITTTGESGGQVYLADDSMFDAATEGGDPETFDASIVLALDPVPTGGSITINGPVTTGLFQAAAGTSLTTQAITADEIDARALGTATINGLWSSPLVTLASSDIDITGTGGIAGGTNGEVNLFSTNTSRMLIGDGLTGSGYALTNAEFGRISGGDIAIIAGVGPGAAANTLIGDLTVTVGESGNIRNTNGGLAIVGLSESGEERDGIMRVAGDVVGTGFANTNYLAFATEHFELDAENGSISLSAQGGGLGGELDLYADTIHVAALPILLQLQSDPTYNGYQDDLNEAAAVQRPDGVIRADTLWIESDNLQDVLIQNTGADGTDGTRAGFLVRQAFINDDEEVAGPPGSINLIVNGQVVTEGGTLTGVEARDALVDGADITPFTSNSTINGCPLTGECIIRPPQPPPVADVVDNQIDLIFSDPLGDSEFGNEDSIDDNEDGDEGANNPISPPQPLFDTRPLIPSSEIDDPVSGTGNPALVGGDQCENQDENGQCPVNPVKGDSQ